MKRLSSNNSGVDVFQKTRLALIIGALTMSNAAMSQNELEEVVVTGIRSSLANALDEKRDADNLIEVIQAEDIGKLPDQNLAEVLENVTGIQITRTAGVGTGVQIRGTNANRTEINGVSTVGSGSGRSGIDFEDVSAAIISAVEVTKAPEAKTIEGSVGGTINLRTIRPLELKERLAAVRIQGEESSLSADGGMSPRYSGTYGDNWTNDMGEFGVVVSGSWSEQDVSAFRPRVDRDNLVLSSSGVASAQAFDFLPIQFFVQDYDNYEYQTQNFAGAFEWAPNDSVTLFFDAVVSEQERRQESSRIQASGVSDLRNVAAPSSFETVNFGSLNGQQIGSIEAAYTGVIPVEDGDADPNLRMSSDTNSRLTDSDLFRLGANWERGDLSGTVELSSASSNTTTPSFNTTLNYINPNVAVNSSNENGTPFEYDLSGGSLAFGIAFDEANAPTREQLLDPANYMLRDVNISQDKTENSEDAFRADFNYRFEWSAIKSLDFGYRFSRSQSTNNDVRSNTGLRSYADSPRGDLFSQVLTNGPTNFNSADGRSLYVRDYLLVDAAKVASNPAGVLAAINEAIVANNAVTGSTRGPISSPTSSLNAFFDIEEETSALYLQANFEQGIFRGNIGLRYIDTDVSSTGNTILNGTASKVTSQGSYDFILPRFNLVASVTDDVIVRAGWSKDIRRPSFDDLSTSVTYSTSPNPAVSIGNPGLQPEEVKSFDVSAEWYFAPSSVVSIGFFKKERTGLFVNTVDSPSEDPVTGYRDTTAPCEAGGVFNPIADTNVFAATPGVGVCVPAATVLNGAGKTTQEGVEIAIQYDLAGFEEELGWMSGFGFIANFTKQEFSGGDTFLNPTSRANAVFTALGSPDASLRAQLLDLSETAYNVTAYYEKYGVSARVRYTWREAYRSDDFGSTSSYPWGFPVVQEDRGQVNASMSYAVSDDFSVSVEGINLTEQDVEQSCVNEGALLCFQGLTDRRIIIGASYRF